MNHQEQFDQAVIAAGGDFRKAFRQVLGGAQLTDLGWACLLCQLIKIQAAEPAASPSTPLQELPASRGEQLKVISMRFGRPTVTAAKADKTYIRCAN